MKKRDRLSNRNGNKQDELLLIMKKNKPNYHIYLSKSLCKDADALVSYLSYFPFETPTHCPHCHSRSFHLNNSKHTKIMNYRCNRCKRGFNRLTNTPLAGSRYLELWTVFAEWRLSGATFSIICEELNISSHAASFRDKAIQEIMKTEFPRLYKWWKPHQDRIDNQLSPQVAVQAEKFEHWLHDLMTRKQDVCPHCGSKNNWRQGPRPSFRCRPCDRVFNVLSGTLLDSLSHIELWPQFVQALIRGDSNSDMHRQLGLRTNTLAKWRQRFLQLMREQGFNELAEWSIWQRQRRYVQTSEQAKKGQVFIPISGSRFKKRNKSEEQVINHVMS